MEITVRAGERTYPVIAERGVLKDAARALRPFIAGKKVAVVTDDIVAGLHLGTLSAALPEGSPVYVIPHGEASKNWAEAGRIVEWLAGAGLTRSDAVIALGGGVVGDIAGFAASVYMRGISYIQVPTTLLAGIDSSVGGKTAVDLTAGKNLAGRIYPPSAVIFDPDALSTLPPAEWKCGLGEAVKYAVLAGGEIFDIMREGVTENNLERLVDLAVDYKRRIVEEDENEKGLRRLLNLGHTFGHAVETESALGFPHGVCVAMGIKIIARACVKAGMLPKEDYLAVTSLLQKYGFPDCPYPVGAVAEHIVHDKKIEGGKINVVTIRGIGKCDVVPMTLGELKEFVS